MNRTIEKPVYVNFWNSSLPISLVNSYQFTCRIILIPLSTIDINHPKLRSNQDDGLNGQLQTCNRKVDISSSHHYSFQRSFVLDFMPLLFYLVSSSHSTRYPSCQTPSLEMFFFLKTPLPCCLPFFHYPSYTLPSRNVKIPNPSFLSFLYSPSYLRPSSQVNTPFPSILLFFHYPSQMRPSFQTYLPNPWMLFSKNYPS